MWKRFLGRAVVFLIVAHVSFFAVLWLLGEPWQGGRHRDVAIAASTVLLSGAGILAALVAAIADTLHAVVVAGPLLRSLGGALLTRTAGPGGSPNLADQFEAFGSGHDLARVARIADLPLIVFLARVVLRTDVKSLLHAAQTGLGPEGVIRELERQSRDRAALLLRRLRALAWLSLGLAVALPFLIGWLLRESPLPF
jgi:hypothetical protein